MADVFEARTELDEWRERLWALIARTPALDWLLLTKRPEFVGASVPWGDNWPTNVWLGTTAENQHWAERRVPHLLQHPASVRFLSCEPLLGTLDLRAWLSKATHRGVDWVIVGGESGGKARPMNPEWARSIRDQCLNTSASFHFKQWGNWAPDQEAAPASATRVTVPGKGGKPIRLVKSGKWLTGRLLDGRPWDELPQQKTTARAA